MNPYKLTSEEHPGRHVWACGACHHTCVNEAHARTCCACRCGTRILRGHVRCGVCEAAEQSRLATERHVRELKLIAAAKIVDRADYDGDMVTTTPHGEEDSYHDPDDEILDHEDNPIAWAWACTETTLQIGDLDARDILDNATEEWFEGAVDHFDVDGIQKLLDGWCESQKRVKCWHADPTRIVVLDPARREEVVEMHSDAQQELADMSISESEGSESE